jgi:hypothetical protein
MTEEDAGERGLPALMRKLRSDPGFRRRFAGDVSATLRRFDIDPSSFVIPNEIGEDQIAQFLANWAGGTGPDDWTGPGVTPPIRPADSGAEEVRHSETAQDVPPLVPLSNVVYGPPPGPREGASPPPSDRKGSSNGGNDLGVPTPVYGPPPGRSWLRRLFSRGKE